MRNTILAGALLLLTACGGAGRVRTPPPELPRGAYRVFGDVAGHAFEGQLHVGDDVVLSGNTGSCRMLQRDLEERLRVTGRPRLALNCGILLVLEWDAGGFVRATGSRQIVETRERNGECVRWEPAAPGRQPRCAQYRQIVDTVTREVTGDLRIERAGI